MQIRPLSLDGVFEIIPRKFGDDRGFFSETYKIDALRNAGIDFDFVQENHSYSAAKGVVRGLHYQLPPFAQDKLLRVTRGSILDVAVDIRKSSSTFGDWVAQEVSAEKWNQILIPKGFAHGFITLVENTEVIYKVTNHYAPEHDRSIRFDDPAIGINWPIPANGVQLSSKDQKAPLLANAEVFD
ncbi:dTDP-4-dehydrorhamnose 3,5-epimerase [Brucella pseudogrignonensis]|uniref:dTDP-4-dehydrorhamnose 3,5-epimerase n=1 Tax=Brucella pseudogrignonensis TaxID=419475 RepID=UPI00124C169D|nr:dTDP-4-dehydrorhamnose 3,5-epimerase [Brucella pseudogrignonensis]KAB2685054.1 dTDP-4-dehydrorhamnose 3,5-epimerase [Brucella pseudogrignonensis]